MYEKEKAVKSKIVKLLTAAEEDDDDDGTSCATRRSRHQAIDDSHIERRRERERQGERDADEVGNGGKMELPEGPHGKP